MFSVKGFAVGKNVTPSSGSAAAVTMASNIVVSIAGAKHVVRNVELQTFATGRVRREGLTSVTGREPIDNGWLQFALWIKVPLPHTPPAISSCRCFSHRLPQKVVANKATQSH
jgi:hypothetical protein